MVFFPVSMGKIQNGFCVLIKLSSIFSQCERDEVSACINFASTCIKSSSKINELPGLLVQSLLLLVWQRIWSSTFTSRSKICFLQNQICRLKYMVPALFLGVQTVENIIIVRAWMPHLLFGRRSLLRVSPGLVFHYFSRRLSFAESLCLSSSSFLSYTSSWLPISYVVNFKW